MLLKDIFAKNPMTFSFEFFPPATEKGWESLFHTISPFSHSLTRRSVILTFRHLQAA